MTENFETVARLWIKDALSSMHPVRKLVEHLDSRIDALEKERDEAIDLVYETCDFLDPRTKKSIHDLIKERDRLREALKLAETVIRNNWGPVGTEDPPLIAETRAAIKQCYAQAAGDQ